MKNSSKTISKSAHSTFLINKLKENEEKFKGIFEGATDGIIAADIKTKKLIFANPKICELTGYSEEELLKLNVEDIHPKKDLPYVLDQFKRQAKKQINLAKDIPVLKKDNSIIYCDVNSAPIKIRNKKLLLGFFRDITDRKKTEEDLIKSKERFRFLVSSSPAVIYTSKTQDDYGGTFVSDNITQQTGHKPEDFTKDSKFWIKHIHPGDRKRVLHNLSNLFKKDHHSHEYRFRFKDGKYHYIRDEMNLIKDEKGRPKEIIGYLIDITEKKEAEKENEELQKKLKEYTKKLELKIKKLEKNKTKLTDKEKIVLWGLTRYPDYSDLELGKKLKMNRSTITSIKNRLKSKKLYSVENIPSLNALGAELTTIGYGLFEIYSRQRDKFNKKIAKAVSPVILLETNNRLIWLNSSKNMIDFENNVRKNITLVNEQKTLNRLNLIHFFHGLSDTDEHFDFSNLLKDSFEIKIKDDKDEFKNPKKIDLNKNEKRVLLALLEYPECSAYDLSFKLDLTTATIARIKKKLIKERVVRTSINPNINQLGFEITVLIHLKHPFGVKKDYIKSALKNSPHTVFFIGSNNESIAVTVFHNLNQYNEFIEKINFKDKKKFLEEPITLRILNKDIQLQKIDFLTITKQLLK